MQAFKVEFGKGYIDDPVQRKMYEERGVDQFRTLLQASPRGSANVIATEHKFSFKLGKGRSRDALTALTCLKKAWCG